MPDSEVRHEGQKLEHGPKEQVALFGPCPNSKPRARLQKYLQLTPEMTIMRAIPGSIDLPTQPQPPDDLPVPLGILAAQVAQVATALSNHA
jgi:hypothetical protein